MSTKPKSFVCIHIQQRFINFIAIVTHFIVPELRQQTFIRPYWIITFYTKMNFQQVQHATKMHCMKTDMCHFELLALALVFQLLLRLFCAQTQTACSLFYTFQASTIPQSAEWSMNLSKCLSYAIMYQNTAPIRAKFNRIIQFHAHRTNHYMCEIFCFIICLFLFGFVVGAAPVCVISISNSNRCANVSLSCMNAACWPIGL